MQFTLIASITKIKAVNDAQQVNCLEILEIIQTNIQIFIFFSILVHCPYYFNIDACGSE